MQIRHIFLLKLLGLEVTSTSASCTTGIGDIGPTLPTEFRKRFAANVTTDQMLSFR